MLRAMCEYLFWDAELATVEDAPAEHLHRYTDAQGVARVALVQPSDDELRRVSSRMADLWATFDDFERYLVQDAIRRREEAA